MCEMVHLETGSYFLCSCALKRYYALTFIPLTLKNHNPSKVFLLNFSKMISKNTKGNKAEIWKEQVILLCYHPKSFLVLDFKAGNMTGKYSWLLF